MGFDYANKQRLEWISVIRLPDFVARADFDWAVSEAAQKKKQDFSAVEFLPVDEGLCVQLLHVGPFDDEPASVAKMDAYIAENGYENDFSDARWHHEIYLSDARKVAPERWKTVIRHPVRRLGGKKGPARPHETREAAPLMRAILRYYCKNSAEIAGNAAVCLTERNE